MVSGLKHDRYSKKIFDLPPIRTSNAATMDDTQTQTKKDEGCTSQGPHGFWSLRSSSPTTTNPRQQLQLRKQSTTQGYEVETNPPFVPIHINPRVNIYAFDASQTGDLFRNGYDLDNKDLLWIFGAQLPSSTKMNTHEEKEKASESRGGSGIDSDYDDDNLQNDYPRSEDDEEHDNELAEQMQSRLMIRPQASVSEQPRAATDFPDNSSASGPVGPASGGRTWWVA